MLHPNMNYCCRFCQVMVKIYLWPNCHSQHLQRLVPMAHVLKIQVSRELVAMTEIEV